MTLAIIILVVCYSLLGMLSVGLLQLLAFDSDLSWFEKILAWLLWPIPVTILLAFWAWPLVLLGLVGGTIWAVFVLL